MRFKHLEGVIYLEFEFCKTRFDALIALDFSKDIECLARFYHISKASILKICDESDPTQKKDMCNVETGLI